MTARLCRCWTEPARFHEGHCCMAHADLWCHQDEGMAALAAAEKDVELRRIGYVRRITERTGRPE